MSCSYAAILHPSTPSEGLGLHERSPRKSGSIIKLRSSKLLIIFGAFRNLWYHSLRASGSNADLFLDARSAWIRKFFPQHFLDDNDETTMKWQSRMIIGFIRSLDPQFFSLWESWLLFWLSHIGGRTFFVVEVAPGYSRPQRHHHQADDRWYSTEEKMTNIMVEKWLL